MKRLIISLVFALGILLNTSSASAFEQWKFQMFEPTTTTQTTLNIEYKVLSINKDDTFTIKLYQNDLELATQNVTTDYGDSGVFIINIPASGSYTYKTTALNGTEEKTETRTVQITDAPQPIVTIVNTVATTSTAGNQLTSTVAPKDIPANDLSADLNKDNDNKNEDNQKSNSQGWGYTAGVILFLLAIAGGGYYYMVMRKANKN